jgi:hypothetical protein
VYWSALEQEVKQRKEAYQDRWQKGGKKIGEYEEYLRGGKHPSLQQIVDSAKSETNISDEKNADLVAAEVGKLSVNA